MNLPLNHVNLYELAPQLNKLMDGIGAPDLHTAQQHLRQMMETTASTKLMQIFALQRRISETLTSDGVGMCRVAAFWTDWWFQALRG